MFVRFQQWNCTVVFDKYISTGATAIALHDADDGENVAVATANIDDLELQDNEVVIKDYSENKGMLSALFQAGVVHPAHRVLHLQFVSLPIAHLTDAALLERNQQLERQS